MDEQLQNELEEQARLLGMSAERECDLRGKLERERALADRLGQSLLRLSGMSPLIHAHAMDDLTAWKDSRSERPTPETDALASEHRGAVIWPDFARRLERERDGLKDQLTAAIMSIRLQQRIEQQTNEQP